MPLIPIAILAAGVYLIVGTDHDLIGWILAASGGAMLAIVVAMFLFVGSVFRQATKQQDEIFSNFGRRL